MKTSRFFLFTMGIALGFLALLDARSACAQDSVLKFESRADLAPEYRMFIPAKIHLDEIRDYTPPAGAQANDGRKGNQKRSNWRINVSMMDFEGHKVDPFDGDKFRKWDMLKSLPGELANAQTYQDKLEIVGRIFEPKVTLSIEF